MDYTLYIHEQCTSVILLENIPPSEIHINSLAGEGTCACVIRHVVILEGTIYKFWCHVHSSSERQRCGKPHGGACIANIITKCHSVES